MNYRTSVNLSDVLELADPGVWGPEDRESGISVLRSTNFNNDGTVDFAGLSFRDIPAKKRLEKALQPEDIVLERSGGGPKQPVGRVVHFRGHSDTHAFGNFCQRLRARRNICVPRFLFWYLYWFHATERTLSFQKQTTGIRNLEYKRYLAHVLDIPVPSEQRLIAEVIDRIAALRHQQALTDKKARRILPALFHRTFGDPSNWAEDATTPLGELVDIQGGGTPSKKNPAYWDGELPWVSPKDMKRDFIDDAEDHITELAIRETNSRLVPVESILVVVRGMILARHVPLATNTVPVAINQDMKALTVTDRRVSPLYLFAAMQALAHRLHSDVSTAAHGTRRLDTGRLLALPILIPDEKKHNDFVGWYERVRELDEKRGTVSPRLDRVFRVLLHLAFTGALTSGWRNAHKDELETEMLEHLASLEEAKTTQPKPTRKKRSAKVDDAADDNRHAGRDMFNKAALVTYITVKCHDPERPQSLGRTKLAKLFYLVQRRAEISLTDQFTRRAAGPLDDAIHKFLSLAKKQGWLALPTAKGKLKPVMPGDDPKPAIEHVKQRWADALEVMDRVLDTMKGWGWEALERWATVENAAQQLAADGKPATLDDVKAVIAAEPKWRAKLKRDAFADSQIQSTLAGLRRHGYLPAQGELAGR